MIVSRILTGLDDLSDCYNIRRQVFIDELGLPSNWEKDDYDADSLHVIAGEDAYTATARLSWENNQPAIERIAILPSARGQGIDELIIRLLLLKALELGADSIYATVSADQRPIFNRLGFQTLNEPLKIGQQTFLQMKILREQIVLNNC